MMVYERKWEVVPGHLIRGVMKMQPRCLPCHSELVSEHRMYSEPVCVENAC
jgi:hypothetical protein